MIKSKEVVGPSCLTRAHDDEPIFVLRANDEYAPMLVRAWADNYLGSKGIGITDMQFAKYNEALELADQMDRWKRANLTK
jgi:hypothetical protein